MSGTSRKTRSDVQRNRQALIVAAHEVFAEQGLDVPLDSIAKRAELGNATMYRYFPSRESLALEALRLSLRRHLDQICSAQQEPTGWAGLVRYLGWLFEEQLSDRGLTAMLLTIKQGLDPEVDSLRKDALDRIGALVEVAKSEGDFRQDRWLDDVVLFIDANDRIADVRGDGARAASHRLLELATASLSTAPYTSIPVTETASVLALRRAMLHRLVGLPLGPDDL